VRLRASRPRRRTGSGPASANRDGHTARRPQRLRHAMSARPSRRTSALEA
jgi:hypothetical protein